MFQCIRYPRARLPRGNSVCVKTPEKEKTQNHPRLRRSTTPKARCKLNFASGIVACYKAIPLCSSETLLQAIKPVPLVQSALILCSSFRGYPRRNSKALFVDRSIFSETRRLVATTSSLHATDQSSGRMGSYETPQQTSITTCEKHPLPLYCTVVQRTHQLRALLEISQQPLCRQRLSIILGDKKAQRTSANVYTNHGG